MEQCRGGRVRGEGKMKRWMEERGREERRRKDESIIVLSDKHLFITTPYTPITESGHISVTKFGHAMVDLNTVVMYVNKHTQENYGNKTHHQQTKNQHWLLSSTHIRQHWPMKADYYLLDHSHLQSGWDGSKSYTAQLHQKFCHVFCWSLMCNKYHHCYQWHCKNVYYCHATDVETKS